jgi:nicotinate-nucleotide pyrophosphorylase (carboxylating)
LADAATLAAVRRALAEDRARDDVTTRLLDGAARIATARFVAEERLVVAGLEVAGAVFDQLDSEVAFTACVEDGDRVDGGTTLATARASAMTLLAGERVALNFLQRLSGIATATRRAVEAVAGTGARITHTRKTTPGLRDLELRAVLAGGGVPNRTNLADAVLWKDNHWALLREAGALAATLASAPPGLPIVVEVEDEAQLEAALAAGVQHLLVDNQPPERVAAWARRAGPAVTIQASGGITALNARAYAAAGATLIAVGALTHSVVAAGIRCDLAAAPP